LRFDFPVSRSHSNPWFSSQPPTDMSYVHMELLSRFSVLSPSFSPRIQID
jgi:hypothetical protein